MDEVVGHLDALERPANGCGVRDVGGDSPHPLARRPIGSPRDGDHLLGFGEDRDEGRADHSRRSQHRDRHECASAMSRAK